MVRRRSTVRKMAKRHAQAGEQRLALLKINNHSAGMQPHRSELSQNGALKSLKVRNHLSRIGGGSRVLADNVDHQITLIEQAHRARRSGRSGPLAAAPGGCQGGSSWRRPTATSGVATTQSRVKAERLYKFGLDHTG